MAGAQKSGTILPAGFPNQIDGRLRILRVKTRSWFICKYESGPRCQCSRHGDSLLLPDTQFPRHGPRAFDAESLEQCVRSMTMVAGWTSREEKGQFDVLSCGEPFQKIEGLEDHSNRLSSESVPSSPRESGDVLVIDENSTAVWLEQSCDEREETAISAA